MKFAKIHTLIIASAMLAACQPIVMANSSTASSGLDTNATTLNLHETVPLKGSEKVSVHAYSYLRMSAHCSRTIAISFQSLLAYPQTLVALRNRAMITGANALAITDWNEKAGYTTLSAHFFDCHSKKGL
jgi:hypothetical protein